MPFNLRKFISKTISEAVNYGPSMEDFKKWKRKNVTYRGMTNGVGEENGAGARFGEGLYTASLSNKTMAKGYGDLYFVVNGRPKNPVSFQDANVAEIWLQQNLFKKYGGLKNFNAITTIPAEMLKLGYDGLEVKGREIVNYAPVNVMYFSNERQLIQYYEDNIESKEYIKEFISKTLQESIIGEEYPKHFDINYFKALKTFRQRIQYCQDNLQRLGVGSSRIVYKIDDEKVLKLAKNGKGIAQNDSEIDSGRDRYYEDIIAKVIDYDKDGLWVEMEIARKTNTQEIEKILGFSMMDLFHNLDNTYRRERGKASIWRVSEEVIKKMQHSDFANYLFGFMRDYDMNPVEFSVATAYGIVNRDGAEHLVITDYGVTREVGKTHYHMTENISGKKVNQYIRNITPDESDIPDYFMDNIIAHRNFELKTISILDLLNSDPSFKEYYEAYKREGGRYDTDIENDEGPHEDDLYNWPVVVDGTLLDGYNRCSVRFANGETEVEAYVALPQKEKKEIEEGWTQNLAVALSLFTSVAMGQTKPETIQAKQNIEQSQSTQVHSAILGYLDIYSREIVNNAKDKFQMATAIKEVRIYCQNMRDGKPAHNLSASGKSLFKTVSDQLKNVDNINYYVNQGKGINR